jgi:uncharacterized protein
MPKKSRKRDLFKPNLMLESIFQITPAFMLERDLRGLLLDLDNTLIPYKSSEEAPLVSAWAQTLLETGTQLRLVSNAMPQRVQFWGSRLQLHGVGLASKPWPVAFSKAITQMQLEPHQVGMVGDQLFTDILGGNLAGTFTIMVRPLSDNALPHTRWARKMERLVLKNYGKKPH